MIDFASGLWNQRQEIARAKDRLATLRQAVDWPSDLFLGQWAQLYAFCLEFAPDLIVELGRGYGNSTCVFAEAANRSGSTRVISIGYDAEQGWSARTAPRVARIVAPEWFSVLEILHRDILETDFKEMFGRGKRIFLFWDAHGTELALYLLADAFPALQSKEHLVVVHDITDVRYNDVQPDYVRADGAATVWLGPLFSPFEELIPLYDFLSRNNISFDTPEHSLRNWLNMNPEKANELRSCWGPDFPGPSPLDTGHWVYFDLSTKGAPVRPNVFPSYPARREEKPEGLRPRHGRARGTTGQVRASSVGWLGMLYWATRDWLGRAARRLFRLLAGRG
jgi:cephalosporin hydroxylase